MNMNSMLMPYQMGQQIPLQPLQSTQQPPSQPIQPSLQSQSLPTGQPLRAAQNAVYYNGQPFNGMAPPNGDHQQMMAASAAAAAAAAASRPRQPLPLVRNPQYPIPTGPESAKLRADDDVATQFGAFPVMPGAAPFKMQQGPRPGAVQPGQPGPVRPGPAPQAPRGVAPAFTDPQMAPMGAGDIKTPTLGPGAAQAGKPVPTAAPNEMNVQIFKRNLGNAGVVRILDLLELVANEPRARVASTEFWLRLVQSYFLPSAVMRFTTPAGSPAALPEGFLHGFGHGPQPHTYELTVTTAPRFLAAVMAARLVASPQVTLPGIKFQVMNNGTLFLVSRLHVVMRFTDGSLGTVHGTCRMLLNREFRIEWLDCRVLEFHAAVTMRALETHWLEFSAANGGARDFAAAVRHNADATRAAPNAGLPSHAMRQMQIGSLMAYLKPLMSFAASAGQSLPLRALDEYVAQNAPRDGPVSSPSPRTVPLDEAKVPAKKRRTSSVASTRTARKPLERAERQA